MCSEAGPVIRPLKEGRSTVIRPGAWLIICPRTEARVALEAQLGTAELVEKVSLGGGTASGKPLWVAPRVAAQGPPPQRGTRASDQQLPSRCSDSELWDGRQFLPAPPSSLEWSQRRRLKPQ